MGFVPFSVRLLSFFHSPYSYFSFSFFFCSMPYSNVYMSVSSCCAVFYACLTVFLVNFLWGCSFDFSRCLEEIIFFDGILFFFQLRVWRYKHTIYYFQLIFIANSRIFPFFNCAATAVLFLFFASFVYYWVRAVVVILFHFHSV